MTDDYLRVCGDNEGRVESCPSCPRQPATEETESGSDGVPLREIESSAAGASTNGTGSSVDVGEPETPGPARATDDGADEPSPDGPRSRLSRVIEALALG